MSTIFQFISRTVCSGLPFCVPVIVIAILFSHCKPEPTKKTTETPVAATITDPLSSWQEGATKQSIIDFVTKTTKQGSADFIPVADRIACFDNDGTLWSEQPFYFQLAFALDQVKLIAPQHPEWKKKQPFKALLEGNMKTFMAGGEKYLMAVMAATHAGMDADTFNASVRQWIATATHPKTGKKYNEMVYQPMVELLAYLRANGYSTFIVSGGGVDFMRAWAEEAYGIPPYQVVGTLGGYTFEFRAGKVHLRKMAELNFNDDKSGKPIGIQRSIGKRPVFSAGNSDGDYEMLQYTTTSGGPRFGMIVHHTDSVREVAYDRNSHIGRLDKGLDSAGTYGWHIVDMQQDWKKVFPFE